MSSLPRAFRSVAVSLTVSSIADDEVGSVNPQSLAGFVLAHRRDKTMLPAPFFSEVPADLGDDQTWAHQTAEGHHGDELTHRSGRGVRAIVDDMNASGALALVSRIRRMLAP